MRAKDGNTVAAAGEHIGRRGAAGNVARARDGQAAIGTLVSNLIPIAVCLQIVWIIFLIVWMTLGLPIGPGVEMALPAGVL